MANGDERAITTGKWAGTTQREVSVTAGTTDAVIVPVKPGKRIRIVGGLLVSSAAADIQPKEADASTALALYSLTAGAAVALDNDDNLVTASKDKAFVMTRSASTALKGQVYYTTLDN